MGGCTEPQRAGAYDEPGSDRLASPVADVLLHQPGRAQDVHEDVLGAVRLGEVPVVVHVLVVARRDRRRHHERRRDRELPLGQQRVLHRATSQIGSVRSSSTLSQPTTTGSPMARSSGLPRTSATNRTPSSSSTSAIVTGSSRPGICGAWCTRKLKIVPRPLATTYPRSIAWHDGQTGPGGWRSSPQALHVCSRSSPCRVPSQKYAVSWLTTGRMIWERSGTVALCRGLNLSTRN